MGTSNVCVIACVQEDILTTNSYLPFHLELKWVSTGSDMHAVNCSKPPVACETTGSSELIQVYSQLQLAQPILTHLTELNYFTTHITTHPTLLQL